MRTIQVKFSVDVDDEMTNGQIEEYIRHKLGVCSMSFYNPMIDVDLEANPGSVEINHQ